MYKLKSSLSAATPPNALLSSTATSLWNTQKTRFSWNNRFGLLIFSLCIINVLTQQQQAVVALSLPLQSLSPSSSLVMISPQVNNNTASALLLPETLATNVLTPGQLVINAIPAKDRNNFIMYQLAVGLKTTNEVQIQPRWLSNLEDLTSYYEQEMTELKNVPIYENFATDLLQWLNVKFNFTHQDVYYNLRSRSQLLCTSDGVCYSSADVSGYCCPF